MKTLELMIQTLAKKAPEKVWLAGKMVDGEVQWQEAVELVNCLIGADVNDGDVIDVRFQDGTTATFVVAGRTLGEVTDV